MGGKVHDNDLRGYKTVMNSTWNGVLVSLSSAQFLVTVVKNVGFLEIGS